MDTELEGFTESQKNLVFGYIDQVTRDLIKDKGVLLEAVRISDNDAFMVVIEFGAKGNNVVLQVDPIVVLKSIDEGTLEDPVSEFNESIRFLVTEHAKYN